MSEAKNSAIACIGWGSLIWDSRDLPHRGSWQNDGPLLPVEFARESGGKTDEPGEKITLVICPDTPRVRTYWALLDVPDISTAQHELAAREYAHAKAGWIEENIGVWDKQSGKAYGREATTISAWARRLGLGGVVWTNLQFGFKTSRGTMPREDEVIEFLRHLSAAKRSIAEEYVRHAPAQIDTPYRRLIERDLGWLRHSRDSPEALGSLRAPPDFG